MNKEHGITRENLLLTFPQAIVGDKSLSAMVVTCDSYDQAFQKAIELGGQQFLQDMFSSKPAQGLIESPASPFMEMGMI